LPPLPAADVILKRQLRDAADFRQPLAASAAGFR